MTIWWSKATRLLEFSRSVNRTLRSRKEGGSPERDGEEGEGLVLEYSSSWIEELEPAFMYLNRPSNQYVLRTLAHLKVFGPLLLL